MLSYYFIKLDERLSIYFGSMCIYQNEYLNHYKVNELINKQVNNRLNKHGREKKYVYFF